MGRSTIVHRLSDKHRLAPALAAGVWANRDNREPVYPLEVPLVGPLLRAIEPAVVPANVMLRDWLPESDTPAGPAI